MKITKGKLRQIIREENQRLMVEAHGLSAEDAKRVEAPVSYTHLTLPTIYSV